MSENPALDRVFEIALQAHTSGDFDTASHLYREIIGIEPAHKGALGAFGVLLAQQGAFLDSVEVLGHAVQLPPEDAESWSNYGNALRIVERFQESISACERALALEPRHVGALSNLSAALRAENQIGASIEAARRACDLDPGREDALVNLASGYQAMGEIELALQHLSTSPFLPEQPERTANYLFTSLYSDQLSASEILAAHQKAGRFSPVRPPRRATGPIRRIGFVSGDLHGHPVGRFLLPLLEHASGRYEFIAYANQVGGDETTGRLSAQTSAWRNIFGVPAATVAEVIQADGIDLLVDLSGYSARSRLDVFALRPAPRSATFLGYSSTTGHPAIDWLIADAVTIPPGHEDRYSERIARLSGPLLCDPSSSTGTKANPSGQHLISFNNPAKISPSCLDAWAQVLTSCPEATLTLKYKFFGDEAIRDRFHREFQHRGIEPSRVTITGFVSRDEHHSMIRSAALALDPFPYTGATTTLECLQAGVPVLTLAGDRYSARMSASLLATCNRPDLCRDTPDEYIQRAVEILEKGTAPIDASPLRDGTAAALGFEAAIAQIEAG